MKLYVLEILEIYDREINFIEGVYSSEELAENAYKQYLREADFPNQYLDIIHEKILDEGV